ncbi:MAG: nuclear transport factor 2 family protein [Flavobacterium sp.]|nr:MAG: nuclear transport factor 2 family protein [Flavobacterium sp.]
MNTNQQIIEEFYAAFASSEPETIASCYHPEAVFHDPVFGKLEGADITDMWRMLLDRAKGRLGITFSDIAADAVSGKAQWNVQYEFGPSNRLIVNTVSSRFRFRDGLIVEHNDEFDFYRWNRQAFGLKGWLLGNTSYMQNKVREQAVSALRKWQSAKSTSTTP